MGRQRVAPRHQRSVRRGRPCAGGVGGLLLPQLRRAVAADSTYGGCSDAECRRLLQIMEPLLEDDDPYVRENMGTFAIGDSFLRHGQELTAAWLGRAGPHPRAQWNVAMALSFAGAARQFPLLRQVAADDRTVVKRAAYRAVAILPRGYWRRFSRFSRSGSWTQGGATYRRGCCRSWSEASGPAGRGNGRAGGNGKGGIFRFHPLLLGPG